MTQRPGVASKLYIDAMPIVEPHMSGVGHLTLDLIREFVRQKGGHELILVVPLGKKRLLKKYQFPHNVKIKTIPLPARVFAFLNNYGIIPPLDMILGKGAYLFPNYRNWPLIASTSLTYIHDVSFLKFPETVQPKNLRYLQENVAKWIARSDHVLTLTETSKKDICKLLDVDSEKVNVVPCGVNNSVFFRRPETEVTAAKKKYDISVEEYMLFVGNLEPRKNLKNLLLAYEMMYKSKTKLPALVIVGAEGWLNDEVQSLILKLQKRGLPILRPSQFVIDEDLAALYSGATVFVHPALYEGFGMPPIEAMACRLPVAASDIPVLREVLDGAAVMFDPQNPKDISKKIIDLLNNIQRQKHLVQLGVQQSQKYTWTNAVKIIQGLVSAR